MMATELSSRAREEIKRYAEGKQSAEATAYRLFKSKGTEPGESCPKAADVIVWSKQLGYGLPTNSAEEAQEAADRAIRYFSS